MIMKASILLAAVNALLLLMACGESTLDPMQREPIDPKKLIGTWVLRGGGQIYHSATFRPDSQAVLGCRACDTIYRFHYTATDSSIIFYSYPERTFISNDVIEKLTIDTLIFRTLLTHRSQQSYRR